MGQLKIHRPVHTAATEAHRNQLAQQRDTSRLADTLRAAGRLHDVDATETGFAALLSPPCKRGHRHVCATE